MSADALIRSLSRRSHTLDAILDLAPETLLKDAASNGQRAEVLSLRHRLYTQSQEAMDIAGAAVEIIHAIANKQLVITNEEPSIRTCAFCGCTNDYACQSGCAWASDGCCSRCAGQRFVVTEVGRARLATA
jgi:hypothetical protein